MGADMILYSLPLEVDQDTALRRLNVLVEKEFGWAKEVIDQWFSPSDVHEAFEAHEMFYDNETFQDDVIGMLTPEMVTEFLKTYVVDAVYGSLVGNREVTWQSIDGVIWLFTGGMSWGDAPTEMCGVFGALDDMALTMSKRRAVLNCAPDDVCWYAEPEVQFDLRAKFVEIGRAG